MVLPLAQSIQNEIPQVKYATVVTYRQPHIITYGDLKLKQFGYAVSENFLRCSPGNLLKATHQPLYLIHIPIVLTKSAAKALFGNTESFKQCCKDR
jgi:hypothetical protein